MQLNLYGLLIALGILIATVLCIREEKLQVLPKDTGFDIILYTIPLGVIGARLYYVIFAWEQFRSHPLSVLYIWQGGLAIYGGIIGGVLGLWLLSQRRKIPLWRLTDVAVPGLLLGQAIGRWGNYFNMEAYGRETVVPWAITVYEAGKGYIHVHPTFLYESIWDVLVFFVLIFLIDKRKKSDGVTTCWYFILYSIGRFFVEGLRTDSLYFMGLRAAQIVSIICIIAGSIALIVIRNHTKGKQDNNAGIPE